MDFDFGRLAEEYVKREPRERKPHSYYASEIPWCLRKVYYSHTARREFPIDKLLLFKAGDQAHWFVRSVLKWAGLLVDAERSISIVDPETDVEIRGRLDDVLVMETGEGQAVVEVKSVARYGLKYISGPKDPHVMQITPYVRVVSARLGYLVYLERDSYASKTFRVDYDPAVLKAALARAVEVDRCIERGEPPVAEARATPGREFECKQCLYSDLCSLEEEP
ncbi:MAG: hypothetical protein JRD89_00900 [Deltaproteobacteria bacterium]|nr:hypothetical protein [Deltaproteobacteria bacterium]